MRRSDRFPRLRPSRLAPIARARLMGYAEAFGVGVFVALILFLTFALAGLL